MNFDTPTADTELILPSAARNEEIHVGVSWAPGTGKYKLSKVVTLAPRFLVKNNLSETIYFRQHATVPSDRFSVGPGEKAPIHILRPAPEKYLTVAYTGLNARWCVYA